ncbi:hypothetical protein BCV70DRAFT_78789 [Testicularia cyperi]|uniref:Uncharacterized protein n=1 Tax=Testicularia cyperi TaxID=1882483 RepID=A0A317XTW4_9BASI|nr:hypothetical protein BCV70DRAFT_78789 [Testicularia cyperi]
MHGWEVSETGTSINQVQRQSHARVGQITIREYWPGRDWQRTRRLQPRGTVQLPNAPPFRRRDRRPCKDPVAFEGKKKRKRLPASLVSVFSLLAALIAPVRQPTCLTRHQRFEHYCSAATPSTEIGTPLQEEISYLR